MSLALPAPTPDSAASRALWAALLGSFALHVGTLWWLETRSTTPPPEKKPIEMVIVEVEPPKPPPPPEPPPEAPKPKPVIKIAEPVKPPPKTELPPPPNEPPPEPTKPVPLITGISLSSTTSAGTFAAPVGNTQYGKMDQAVDPKDVKPYAAPVYAPPGTSDTEPEISYQFEIEYPKEARSAGIEGVVRLQLLIDFDGRVAEAKLLKGLGYGLDAAALSGIKKFKFKPAVKKGEAVATSIIFAYRFELN